jgi:hypothetical protein
MIYTYQVVANAAYSYAVIKYCANKVWSRKYWNSETKQMELKWQLNPRTKNLLFTNPWVIGMLRRKHMRKRRITSHTDAEAPSVKVVREAVSAIQKLVDLWGIPPERIFNENETGINWVPELKYQYVPENATRGEAPPGLYISL